MLSENKSQKKFRHVIFFARRIYIFPLWSNETRYCIEHSKTEYKPHTEQTNHSFVSILLDIYNVMMVLKQIYIHWNGKFTAWLYLKTLKVVSCQDLSIFTMIKL